MFKNSTTSPPTCLLLPLRGAVSSASAGLNLQDECATVYLYDTCTSKAIEQQAIGRVTRIGQTQARVCFDVSRQPAMPPGLPARRQRARGTNRRWW